MDMHDNLIIFYLLIKGLKYNIAHSIRFSPFLVAYISYPTIIYRIWENFRVGKLSRLVHKMTIRGKTFAVHQAVANMYCTQQVIQGENFRDRLKNREKRESFPVYGMQSQ